jgi:type VI secretion system secreted protein VgrG
MTPFILTIGEQSLRVLAFRGREAVSHPFRFTVTIAVEASDASDLETMVLGERAVLTLQTAGAPRAVAGILASVEGRGSLEHGQRAFRVELVPRLSLLSLRVTSRVFQEQTVPEIVAAVLGQAAVPMRSALVGKYVPRHYCVQYQESALAFVTRLLAEEGIWYFFEHSAEETLVLADSVHIYQPIAGDPKLVYREGEIGEGLRREEHHVFHFELRRTLAPGAVLERDRDYRKPLLELRGEAPAKGNGNGANGALGAPKSGPVVLPLEAPLLVYEHHGEDDPPRLNDGTARMRLEQLRRRSSEARGSSGCARLVPGLRLELVDHDIDAVNGRYALAAIVHEGRDGGGHVTYTNRFTCVPATLPLRPKLPAGRRALQEATLTAIVVGAEGQEIHTDSMARVRIQFPWDLEGKRNEQSSCWVRVMQPWAGAGFGMQFIPRVGMQVVVGFEGGDPDRPIVLGCVYNGGASPPFVQPGSRTRSGIRTRSTPGAGATGGNELSFDDARGDELLALRAQRDLDVTAARDFVVGVARDQRVRVAGTAIEDVGAKVVNVAGTLRESVGGRVSHTSGNVVERLEGRLTLAVGAGHALTIGGDQVVHVARSSDLVVGTLGKGDHHAITVQGDQVLTATGMLKLHADEGIALTCGSSTIEIGPERVTIRSKAVEIVGADTVSMSAQDGKGPALRLGGEQAEIVAQVVQLLGERGSLLLTKEAKLRGEAVKLGGMEDPKPPADGAGASETQPFKMMLSDAAYGVWAGKRYHLKVDGVTLEGTTDANGTVDKLIPKNAVSVTLIVWLGDDYPTGPTQTRTIHLGPVPGPGTPRGALVRLARLGYFGGEPKDKLDEEARAALKSFQHEHGVKVTGKLDAPTVAKLDQVAGK